MSIDIDQYQKEFTLGVARYPGKGTGDSDALIYTALGMAGELSEYLAKLFGNGRDESVLIAGGLNDEGRAWGDAGEARFIRALESVMAAGKTCEALKKDARDHGVKMPIMRLLPSERDPAFREALKKELGDAMWYIARAAHEAGFTLSDVVQTNIDKLNSRAQRGVLGGSGDNR